MAHSFQRAAQSLRADHGIGSTTVLATALVLLTAWLVWAFRASVPLYQTSLSARCRAASPDRIQVLAEFPLGALGELRAGEPALFRPAMSSTHSQRILSARVAEVSNEIRYGKVTVQLWLEPPAHSALRTEDGATGSVEIQVERVTPAALLMRSAGALVGQR